MLEPRFFQRADVDLRAKLTIGTTKVRADVVNLSEGGALLVLREGLTEGAIIATVLEIADPPSSVALRATVVRSLAQESVHHVAVTFCDVDDATARTLRAIVEKANNMAWDGTPGRIPRDVAVRFVPLIRRLARGLAQRLPPQVSIDDLIGAGFVALVELYAKNPHASLSDLERVSLPRIRWAMLDELRNADPLSRRMRQRARRIAKTARDMQHELGRKPSHAEIAERLRLTPEAYGAALRLAQNGEAVSIDANDEMELPDRQTCGPEEDMQRTESLGRLQTAVDALPPRLKRVLELYYGDDLTLRQIGNILGVTEARISQLLSDAVKRMRSTCSEESQEPAVPAAKRKRSKSLASAA